MAISCKNHSNLWQYMAILWQFSPFFENCNISYNLVNQKLIHNLWQYGNSRRKKFHIYIVENTIF